MTAVKSAALCLLLAVIAACARSDPERELRSTIAAMAAAVEKREPAVLLSSIADDFSRESSAFGKEDVKRVLAGIYLRNAKIHVNAVITDVAVDGARATVKLRVVATGGEGLIPERGQIYHFDTAWRRVDGRWVVYNADWREGT
jgi:hypothetical protein